jgi:hypothetical protein
MKSNLFGGRHVTLHAKQKYSLHENPRTQGMALMNGTLVVRTRSMLKRKYSLARTVYGRIAPCRKGVKLSDPSLDRTHRFVVNVAYCR